ncbi:MAG: succinyl-CoA synthetase beta subunit, partial [Paracoccaceae bacterium]
MAFRYDAKLCQLEAITAERDSFLNIHEYQAKVLLREYGAPVSDGRVVLKAEDAKT